MGLGKTIIELTIINHLRSTLEVYGSIVFAPLRVCQTVWAQEAETWSHTSHLTFSLVHGSPEKRLRALLRKADIYLINYENMVWLVETLERLYLSKGLYPPFNHAVFDEVSKLKNPATRRHRALRRLLPYMPYRSGLTGTPAANGYLDLFGQYLALDDGVRLGSNIGSYKDAYFVEAGWGGYKYQVSEGSETAIKHAISDITLQMDSADYLTLPKVTFNDIPVVLPTAAMAQYNQLEDEMFIELEGGVELEVFNAAAKTTKCLQFANGAVYLNPEGEWAAVHQAKLEALDDVIEEASGSPVLCFYQFKSDVARLQARYPQAVYLEGGMSQTRLEEIMAQWNAGQIPILLAHPASAGHGLNLQYGGHLIVWFGLTWSLDYYLQAIARIDRQGQEFPVMIHRLLAVDTLDYVQAEVLEVKEGTQTSLRNALQEYRTRKYGK